MFDGAASISIYSETRTASEVTGLIGLTPSGAHERGELRPNGKPWTFAFWHITVTDDEARSTAANDDTAGFATLGLLLERLAPHTEVLNALRPDYEIHVAWYGTSGSSQGGFVLPVTIMRALVDLNCNLFGNVYSFDDPEPASKKDSKSDPVAGTAARAHERT